MTSIAWPIVAPLLGAALSLVIGSRGPAVLPALTAAATGLASAAVVIQVWRSGTIHHAAAGWSAPLGIELRADGLSALMIAMTAVVGAALSLHALGDFARRPSEPDSPNTVAFWPLWLFAWGALNALFLSADLFNLYVTLELVTFAVIPLIALAGSRAALTAATRYFLAAVFASLVYLLGIALLYSAFGTLDIAGLGRRVTPDAITRLACALTTMGLLLKTALFPLHFWLPPAHANAPAPVSALLSALVVKASFYLLVRLWAEVFPSTLAPAAADLLGGLGAAAIVWGSFQALRQERLKLLVAYSTVAQIGYLFLLFPLFAGSAPLPVSSTALADAWCGVFLYAVAHALAKAAMFLTAGALLRAVGHDRVAELSASGQRLSVAFLTFALAGVSVMGLPPSGGFTAKWLLLQAAIARGQWWWAVVILAGGLLGAAYIFRVLRHAFVPGSGGATGERVLCRWVVVPLGLALLALALGFLPSPALRLVQIGAPPAPPAQKGTAP